MTRKMSSEVMTFGSKAHISKGLHASVVLREVLKGAHCYLIQSGMLASRSLQPVSRVSLPRFAEHDILFLYCRQTALIQDVILQTFQGENDTCIVRSIGHVTRTRPISLSIKTYHRLSIVVRATKRERERERER